MNITFTTEFERKDLDKPNEDGDDYCFEVLRCRIDKLEADMASKMSYRV